RAARMTPEEYLRSKLAKLDAVSALRALRNIDSWPNGLWSPIRNQLTEQLTPLAVGYYEKVARAGYLPLDRVTQLPNTTQQAIAAALRRLARESPGLVPYLRREFLLAGSIQGGIYDPAHLGH